MKVSWTETATNQVLDIAEYISVDSSKNASKWVDDIHEKAESLIHHPYKYPEPEGACNTHIRECIFGNFRIIYRIDPDIIYIMNVKRGAQEKNDEDYIE
ncbi:MAG: type II toxin-antitoxin system RelE/ParE family toxin [Planctomycetes bacterium]|nr:type II toxin-antitoxin system RelE/ParE family toxin [Planctomycetota bacterium]